MSSFYQDEEKGNDCKWVQCDKCKEATHIDCIPEIHRMLTQTRKMSICALPVGLLKVKYMLKTSRT